MWLLVLEVIKVSRLKRIPFKANLPFAYLNRLPIPAPQACFSRNRSSSVIIRLTAREFEGGDPGLPKSDCVHVLVGVPESAVVHRVDIHGGVVAPTIEDDGRVSGRQACYGRVFAPRQLPWGAKSKRPA